MRLIKAIRIGLLFIIGFGVGIGVSYGYPYYQELQSRHHFQQNYDHRSSNTVGGITSQQKQILARLNYHSGQYPIIYLNNGKSTLNPKSWKTNHVNYQQLDAQQRTSASNTAFL